MSIRAKEGVQFTVITRAGLRILSSLLETSEKLGHDLTVTSACEGEHTGPNDPHPHGYAYDVRSQDVADKEITLVSIMVNLKDGLPVTSSDGLVTANFFGWLEQPGTPNEHFHIQLRHGVVYT